MDSRQPIIQLQQRIAGSIIGQEQVVARLVIGLLANGNLLLEGLPGLAKTRAVNSLARHLAADFSRIQFTPDLLPSDVTGTEVMHTQADGPRFRFEQGPIFANIVLADEINRAPAKVQSALLEAMQERQVTIGDETFRLDDPFMVMATQNPIEQEGTYPLPEAQVDRFMLKLRVTYPDRKQEREILDRMAVTRPRLDVEPVLTPDDVVRLRELADEIFMDDKIKDYIVDLVNATREPGAYKLDVASLIRYGASPRATIYLTMASKANALIEGRGYVTPQDVKSVAMDVMRHRVIVTYEAEAEEKTSEDVIAKILETVEVP